MLMKRILLAGLVLAASSMALADIPASRSLLPEAMQDNLRFAVDISARGMHFSESDEFAHVEALGFDLHKVFASESGDVGTLVLQGYLTRINNLERHPPFFDDDNDWEFVYRIFNFNYKVLNRDRLNLRIGHFEIPFGLEHSINTNGTLRDYIHGPNIGVKADWGVTLNGSLPLFEYEVSASRGSGNEWETKGDPYIYAGRIGTHNNHNFIVGLSVMDGEVFSAAAPDNTVERDRLGVDVRWYIGGFGLFAEHSFGEDEGEDVRSSLVEFNATADDGLWMAYLQFVHRTKDTYQSYQQRSSALKLGGKWDLNKRWDVSAQLTHDLKTTQGAPESNVFAAQIRYRF